MCSEKTSVLVPKISTSYKKLFQQFPPLLKTHKFEEHNAVPFVDLMQRVPLFYTCCSFFDLRITKWTDRVYPKSKICMWCTQKYGLTRAVWVLQREVPRHHRTRGGGGGWRGGGWEGGCCRGGGRRRGRGPGLKANSVRPEIENNNKTY